MRIAVLLQTVGMARTASDYADCPGCKAHFDDQQIDQIWTKQSQGKVATVDLLRAARMLRQPGVDNVQWVRKQLKGQIFRHERLLVVPLSAVHSYAEKHGITVDPLADRLVMWVQRRPAG